MEVFLAIIFISLLIVFIYRSSEHAKERAAKEEEKKREQAALEEEAKRKQRLEQEVAEAKREYTAKLNACVAAMENHPVCHAILQEIVDFVNAEIQDASKPLSREKNERYTVTINVFHDGISIYSSVDDDTMKREEFRYNDYGYDRVDDLHQHALLLALEKAVKIHYKEQFPVLSKFYIYSFDHDYDESYIEIDLTQLHPTYNAW